MTQHTTIESTGGAFYTIAEALFLFTRSLICFQYYDNHLGSSSSRSSSGNKAPSNNVDATQRLEITKLSKASIKSS